MYVDLGPLSTHKLQMALVLQRRRSHELIDFGLQGRSSVALYASVGFKHVGLGTKLSGVPQTILVAGALSQPKMLFTKEEAFHG